MRLESAIRHALGEAGLPEQILATRHLSGGCIHQVLEITSVTGGRFVAKINRAELLPLFEEEARGLRALAATHTVLVPEPLMTVSWDGMAVLLMTAIDTADTRAGTKAWSGFGHELAALHHVDVGSRYGFDHDNHIGSTLQVNTWCEDWVEFNARNRLGYQLNLALENDLLNASEGRAIGTVIDRLKSLIPRQPRPALLHGDLWSGNALAAAGDRIAIIDPACSIGDGWADIAMMRLFGGFPKACLDAYAADNPDHDQLDTRVAVYQLYHVLNHINIFGRGYVAQAMELAQRLS